MATPGTSVGPFSLLGSAEFSAEAAGRKAAPLHELVMAGLPVPPGFIVPPDLDLGGLEARIEAAVRSIGGFPVAARSSGHLEDLAGSSFAGQYVSKLQITTLAQLMEGIAACRNSAQSPQVVSYLKKNGLPQSEARVSVLVQRMVDAAVAGVAFSIHPTTGREEHALFECCRGLGEKLVSGQTAPTRYVVHLENGSVVERDAGAEDVGLDPEVLNLLRRYTLKLQAYFGRPQDIEWAWDGKKLWILQSRPITRIQWRTDIDEFTNADFRDGGVSARVCTPFMYTLYRDVMQSSLQKFFVDIKLLAKDAPQKTWIGMFYGRPYWSTTAYKTTCLKVPGFDEEIFDKDLGIQKQYGSAGPIRTPTNLRTILSVIPTALVLPRNYQRYLEFAGAYGPAFLQQEARYLKAAESFPAMSDEEFLKTLKQVFDFHLQTESDYFTTIYYSVNYQTDFKKTLATIGTALGEPVSSVALMSGLRDVSHMKMQKGFVRLVAVAKQSGIESAEWKKALTEFLQENYFHGDTELDISTPRWGECPERVKQIVQDILRSGIDPKDPDASAEEQFSLFSAEEQRIVSGLQRSFWRRQKFERSFRKQLKVARLYLSRREQMREYSTRVYHLVRQYAIEAGLRLQRSGYLKEASDVFMMHTNDLRAYAQGNITREGVLSLVEFRKLMYSGYRFVEPPGELGKALSQQANAVESGASVGDKVNVFRGIGCSAGVVTGAVRVITELHDANALRKGEILVTRFTDPGWTPVLGLVSGIVTEVGGLLSHAAVIGREYGLPAVLNVPGATKLLKTGQIVQLDGREGTVKVLQTGASE